MSFHSKKIIESPEAFRLVYALHHSDIKPFVLGQLHDKKGLVAFFKLCYKGLGLMLLGLIAYLLWTKQLFWWEWLIGTGLVIPCFGLVIILHELIHGLVFKLLGAPSIRFGFIASSFAFYAEAPEFVSNKRQFSLVALAPFVLINSLLILGVFIYANDPFVLWVLAQLLFLHTMGCVGDFAMLHFMYQYNNVYCFDSKGKPGATYFYERV